MRIIDISVLVDDSITIWPGNKSPQIKRLSNMKKGDAHNETSLEMNVHTGTHIDAPLHFISNGKSIDQINLNTFTGSALVVNLSHVKEITAMDLNKIKLPRGTTRLLFKTSNSLLCNKKNHNFKRNYVGITPDAASWLVKRKIELVGIDYLSIAKIEDAAEVHRILLEKNVAILEGTNLANVVEGEYQLICFPIKIANAEGAPVRAVLLTK